MSQPESEAVREPWSYSGEVWTDAKGLAVVVLPAFVRAHRAGFVYQLTPLEPGVKARLAYEIADGRFGVATDRPHVKVAWRVTPLKEPPS
jgi:hypothetical protein